MYRVVEALNFGSGSTISVGGRTLPVPVLVEDQDGARIFITDQPVVSIDLWVRLHSDGARMLVQALPGDQWAYHTVEDFIATRIESVQAMTYQFPPTSFITSPGLSYRDVRIAQRDLATVTAPLASAFVHLHTHSEYCLGPETRIARADLTWVRADELHVGDVLVGFDENLSGYSSKMRSTIVERVARVLRPSYRIVFEDGTEVVSSELHSWVGTGAKGSVVAPDDPESRRYGGNGRRWILTKDIRPGTRIVRWAKPWNALAPEELVAGKWLAGVADGEGWLHAGQFAFGQNPGVVLDEMVRVCEVLGYPITTPRVQSAGRECRTFRLAGYETVLRFLSQCRPVRFEGRWGEVWEGRRAGGRNSTSLRVTRVEFLGVVETIGIQTSTKTLVAEGLLSHNSPMDGLSTLGEIVDQVVADDQPAAGLTDHGVCSGHPEWQRVANKAGIKPIFGIEAYFVDDRLARSVPLPKIDDFAKDPENPTADEKRMWEEAVEATKARNSKVLNGYHHLILWAKNNEGLRNLWALSTESFRTGFYRYPRMDWEILEKHSEGVIASTACLRGPIASAILEDDENLAVARLGRLQGIYGDDLYLELHSNNLPEQSKVNLALAEMAKTYSVPVVAVVDSHYPTKDDLSSHEAWIACQTNKDIQDETDLFATDLSLYVQSQGEVRNALAYLPNDVVDAAISNTVAIAEKCTATIGGKTVTPTYSKGENGRQRDAERLLEMCIEAWSLKVTGKPRPETEYLARFEREMKLLIDKGFCGYFLMVADYVQWCKKNRILVGPGRGSGGGSLVAYLSGITEIDPVDADLLFERFMTEGREALPDFDVDFPASKRSEVQRYITEKYGEDFVIRVGTHLRLKNKGIVQNLGRAFKSRLPETAFRDLAEVAKIIDAAEATTAGLGLPWDDLWVQAEVQLEPYRARYPELFEMAGRLVGRIKSYGKHAAGLVISTDEPLTDTLPLRGSEEEHMISQWAMGDLEAQGLVKFDILTLRNLDTLQMCVDLIYERHGVAVDFYTWKNEYNDTDVYNMIGEGRTLGVFQIETTSVTRLAVRMKPQNMAEWADVVTLVRPGPMNSGLTDMYLRRRAGEEEISFPDPRMETVLAKTFGCMVYQEDIMAATMVLAGYDSNKADEVRKILGKKQVEKVAVAGEEFVENAVKNGMERDAAVNLWAQMAEFAKYSFNRAHAYAYAILGYWCAWLKYHYPVEFLTACLSTVEKDRIPEFVTETRRMGYKVLPPDINESGSGFRATDEGIRYGLDSIKGVGDSAVKGIIAAQPYGSWDDVRRAKACDLGKIRLLARIGAFDSLVPNRRGLEMVLEAEANGTSTQCVFKDPLVVGPNGLPCTFDWSSEPVQIGRSGKPLKPKPIPKRCTVACRQYKAPPPPDPEEYTPYTDDDIRAIEYDVLGLYLSSSPFDRIPEEHRSVFLTGDQLSQYGEGYYLVAGLVESVRPHHTKAGEQMAFLKINVQDASIDAAVFSTKWQQYKADLKVGALLYFEVKRGMYRGDWSHSINALSNPDKM